MGDRDVFGAISEVICSINTILLSWVRPYLVQLGLLIGKRSGRHVHVLLRQGNRALITIASFMHDAVPFTRSVIHFQVTQAVCCVNEGLPV